MTDDEEFGNAVSSILITFMDKITTVDALHNYYRSNKEEIESVKLKHKPSYDNLIAEFGSLKRRLQDASQ